MDLVFQNTLNPRARAYQLVALEPLIQEMPRVDLATGHTQAQTLVLTSLAEGTTQ